MSPVRRFLAALTSRWAVTALALAMGLPAIGDLHVLAESSQTFHDALAQTGETGEIRVAAACAHGSSRHVEAGTTVARTRCPLCTLRSDRPLAPSQPLAPSGLVVRGSVVAAPQTVSLPVLVSLASSRGPPRA
jgi:hypothetical protein